MAKIYLSVVIPVYNESKRLNNLKKISRFLNQQPFLSELILVNDGSKDDTLKKLKGFAEEFNFRIISYYKNKGKGYAVKKGMLAAKGRYRLFIDIDLSTPIEEFNKFKNYLEKYDVVIGSRKTKGAKVLIHQSKTREIMGKFFTLLSKLILGVPVSDFTCGFKSFSKKAALDIFPKSKINRWGFDSEIMLIAHKRYFGIKEIPVTWRNKSGTKVKFPQDIIKSLKDLLKIKMADIKGEYE